MRKILLIPVLLMCCHFAFGQVQDVWICFQDTTTGLSGFKDLKGNVKITPRFVGFTWTDSFHHIIAVTESTDSSYRQYYLLKDGRKVGHDSVYVFDFSFDCENEGKIIFKDWKKDRVGFLDKNGNPIIPAIYNQVSSFHNGIAIAYRNAKRKCWDGVNDTLNCEHLGWEGGETILINEKNEILADRLDLDLSNINWYSKRINDPLTDTSIYVNIKGKNGLTYFFVDYDREFKQWYYNNFLPTIKGSENNLPNLLFDKITFWTREKGWTSLEKQDFLKTFPSELTIQRFELNELRKISISQESFNNLIFDKDSYKNYLNSCGTHNSEKFPLYSVMLTNYKKGEKLPVDSQSEIMKTHEVDYQEAFEFLRTENGYKLISVSLMK